MFKSLNQNQDGIGRWVVLIIAGVISALVLAFMAMTTFTFGYSVIDAFILADVIGNDASRLISGILCILLFDAGWLVALLSFIFIADSLIQRAMAVLNFIACFGFSFLASAFSVILLSPFSETVDPMVLEIAKYGGVVTVLIAFAINAGSGAVQVLTAPNIAESIRVATRNAKAISFNSRMAKKLDTETFTEAQTLIEAEIPIIAKQRAENALTFYRQTYGYLGMGDSAATQAPTKTQPKAHQNGKVAEADFLAG